MRPSFHSVDTLLKVQTQYSHNTEAAGRQIRDKREQGVAATDGSIKVAITGDFRGEGGDVRFDTDAMASLERCAALDLALLSTPVGQPIPVDALRTYDVIVMKRSPLTAETLAAPDLRVAHIVRSGVGTDHLDLEGCTRAGILVTNTPEAVRRPLASAALALMLNLAHAVTQKATALREMGWAGRFQHVGTGLGGRTLGLVGCGNIGSDILTLSEPWQMRRIVSAPSKSDAEIAAKGAERVDLDTLLAQSDFVVLCCPLTAATANMINANTLARMKKGSFLINIGRGRLVNEPDLVAALASGHLGGAGLDVFDPEPTAADNPLLAMPNVIATAHNIGMTDENIRLGNTSAAAAVLAYAAGRLPDNVVNHAVLDHPRVKARFA